LPGAFDDPASFAGPSVERLELGKIVAGDDPQSRPVGKNGAAFGTPTWVWSIAVDDGLDVRAE